MANRVIRDWTDSERVNELSFEAEVLFLRICMKADDYGSYHGNVRLIKSLLFPLKAEMVTETDVARWLGEIRHSGLLSFYTVEGKQFVRIWNFNQRMRTMKKRFPDMPEDIPPQSAASGGGNPQTAAECLPEDEGNRREVEGEDEDEGKSSPPSSTPHSTDQHIGQMYSNPNHTGPETFDDLSAMEMYLSTKIEECHERYTLSEHFKPAREMLAMRHHMDEQLLIDWAGVFAAQLTGRGNLKKTLKDFASHFSNWMPKQNLKITPQQALKDEQRTTDPAKKTGRATAQSFYNNLKSTGNNQ